MEAKLKEQQQACKLRAQGQSLHQISHRLGVAKSSVSAWVSNVSLGREQREKLLRREESGCARGRRKICAMWREYRKRHPKPKPNLALIENRNKISKFFDIWSPEMAYVLGFFAADGSMYKNKRGSCYVGFYSTDRELITSVKLFMGVYNKIEEYQPKGNRKRRYTLQVGSKKLFKCLGNLGFTPNKSLSLKFPNTPAYFLCHFVRGYFDGDGSVYFGNMGRNIRSNTRAVLTASFICGSKMFLLSLHSLLMSAGVIQGGSVSMHDRAYRLKFNAKDARQLYSFMYPSVTVPCLRRKRDVFERAVRNLGL